METEYKRNGLESALIAFVFLFFEYLIMYTRIHLMSGSKNLENAVKIRSLNGLSIILENEKTQDELIYFRIN